MDFRLIAYNHKANGFPQKQKKDGIQALTNKGIILYYSLHISSRNGRVVSVGDYETVGSIPINLLFFNNK